MQNHERSQYYVYILASRKHGTLYIGVTNDVRTRLEQYRNGRGPELVKKYGVHVLSTWRRSRRRRKQSHAKSS
jgi:predicted GIY-YIG superfamily endonuclease